MPTYGIRLDPLVPVPEHLSAKKPGNDWCHHDWFSPELLQVLLESFSHHSGTVLRPVWDHGLPVWGHPAIPSRCSQLSSFSLCGIFSPWLSWRRCCDTPLGCPFKSGVVSCPSGELQPQVCPLEGRLAHLRTQLLEILRDLGQPRIIGDFPKSLSSQWWWLMSSWSPLYKL